jgi:hypothetical protein
MPVPYWILPLVAALLIPLEPSAAQNRPAGARYHGGASSLQVTTVDTDLDGRTVTLDVQGGASWRYAETGAAAWIVLKGRRAGGPLVPLAVRGTPTVTANRSPDGAEAAVTVPADRVGFFVHRAAPGTGTTHWRLRVPWAAGGGETVAEVRALGVEMASVPTGAFELGTTRSRPDRRTAPGSWFIGTSPAPLSAFYQVDPDGEDRYGGPYRVASEAPIAIGTDAGDLYYQPAAFRDADFTAGDQRGTLAAAFPKGHKGVYQMRYEVTEHKYVAFLNGLPDDQARRRWRPAPNGRPAADFRHTIHRTDGRYHTRRPHRAVGYLSWRDALAWADWMGLRPMTELEFEKAARGTSPARFREFVWGTRETDPDGRLALNRRVLGPDGALAATEDGTERVDGNAHLHMRPTTGLPEIGGPCVPEGYYAPNNSVCRSLSGGDGGWGPVRVGIHGVGAAGNRAAAGAGYYGAMDLGGNVREQVVTVGHPQGRAFRGTHGDGRLDALGRATNADWHATADTSYFAYRGGGWSNHPNHARTADRGYGLEQGGTRRLPDAGFRGVRTLP